MLLAPAIGWFDPVASVRGAQAQEAEIANQVEAYLNSIETLSASFLQIAPEGDLATGTVLISRPGRMRIEYEPPVPVLIIADGTWLIYYDKELEQASYTLLGDSLAGFLLREKIRFSGDIELKGVTREKGVIRVTVTRREAPEAGMLTLVFSERPLQLRQWMVTDGSGEATRVALENPVVNGEIDPEAFEFTPPKRHGDAE